MSSPLSFVKVEKLTEKQEKESTASLTRCFSRKRLPVVIRLMHVYVCATWACLLCKGRAFNSLELGLQKVGNHTIWMPGNEPDLCNKCFYLVLD